MLVNTRWVADVMMADPREVSNTNAVLLLEGGTGTGKSEFVNLIQMLATPCRWVPSKTFVNKDI